MALARQHGRCMGIRIARREMLKPLSVAAGVKMVHCSRSIEAR